MISGIATCYTIYKNHNTTLSIAVVAILFLITGIHLTKNHNQFLVLNQDPIHDDIFIVANSTLSNENCNLILRSLTSSCSPLLSLTIPMNQISGDIYPGDTIQGKLKLKPIVASSNRFFNNFNSFLLNEHIFYKAQLIAPHVKLSRNLDFNLFALAQKFANNCKERLLKSITNSICANLMIALILGDKSNLDKSIKRDFINTGTAHILAVSGLHLGMIYGLLTFGMNLIKSRMKSGRRNIIEILVSLLLIWFFAFITGLSSSVIRAAIMISMFEAGTLCKRNNDAINSLFGCGFIMLCFNPCTLFDIGFQLSFTAVLSILLFNPYIRRIYNPEIMILCKLRDIISVTFSVQILVTPISMYYFQQFPMYFLFSNLVWIPLSFILMVCGIAVVMFSYISLTCSIQIGNLCSFFSKIGLLSFDYIKKLPLITAEGLWIYKDQIAIYFLSALILFFWLKIKNTIYLIVSICIILFLPILQLIRIHHQKNSNAIILYYEKTNLQADLRLGNIFYSTNTQSNIMKSYRTAYHIVQLNALTNFNSLKSLLYKHQLLIETPTDEMCRAKELNELQQKDFIRITNLCNAHPSEHYIIYKNKDREYSHRLANNDQIIYEINFKGPFILNF
jgi:competence protein ComEC